MSIAVNSSMIFIQHLVSTSSFVGGIKTIRSISVISRVLVVIVGFCVCWLRIMPTVVSPWWRLVLGVLIIRHDEQRSSNSLYVAFPHVKQDTQKLLTKFQQLRTSIDVPRAIPNVQRRGPVLLLWEGASDVVPDLGPKHNLS